MEDKGAPKKRNFFINFLIFLVILLLSVYFYARYVEPSRIVVKESRLASENIPINFSGIKIVHLTDIYFGNTTSIENLNKIVEKINILKPDIVVFTGNLFGNNIKNKEELEKSLYSINSTLGKYAVKGNNDYSLEYEDIMKNSEFTILNDEYELIYNEGLTPIFICGLSSSLKGNPDMNKCSEYLLNLEENIYNPKYKIVLTHEGDIIDEILLTDIKPSLILAGNSLNGTIDLPYYGPLFIPVGSKKYFENHYKRGDTEIYISSGIGTDKYPYRLFNSPSFNLYRLKSL